MTCFWNGLLRKLKRKDFENTFNIKRQPKCDEFIILLKFHNVKTIDVKHNGLSLSDKEIDENMLRIKNIKKINKGYLCSSCDPVLLLVSQLFKVNIHHNFNGAQIKYTNKNSTREIHFSCNSNHFF